MRALALVAAAAVAAAPAAAVRVQNLTAAAGPPTPTYPASFVNCLGPINLGWTLPVPGPVGGISAIRVYRNGALVASLAPNDTGYYSLEGREQLFPGDQHEYQVALVNGSGAEEPDRASVTGSVPACDPPLAQIRVLAMLFDFPDAPAASDAEDVARSWLFDSPTSASAFMDNSSYGQTDLYGDVSPVIRLPNPTSSYSCLKCATTLGGMLQLAAQVVPNIGAYDRYAFLFSRTDSVAAAVYITANTVQGTIYAPGMFGHMAGSAAVHEFGHNMGLRHASSWRCPNNKIVGPSLADLTQGNCFVDEYDDRFDPMGQEDNSALRDFGGYNKLLLGHFGLDQVETIGAAALTETGTAVWVDRLERPSGGTKLVDVDLGDGNHYLVENRHQGPTQFFDEVDKVIVRLLPGRLAGNEATQGSGSSALGLWRDGGQLFLRPDTPVFIDNHRRVGITVTDTRTVGNVHQAKVVVFKAPSGPICGLLGIEMWPLLLALGAARRRRARTR
jgi:hypothetical protein